MNFLLDGFSFADKKEMTELIINDQIWYYIRLGMGNHLYLREDFYYEYGIKILDSDLTKRYINWGILTKREENKKR